MRNLVLFTSMILSFWGCSNDKDFGGLENIGWNEKPLQITTRILTTKSTNFIQEFKEGSCDRTKSGQQYLATCITQHESCPIAYIFPVEPKQRQDRCLYYKFRSSRK